MQNLTIFFISLEEMESAIKYILKAQSGKNMPRPSQYKLIKLNSEAGIVTRSLVEHRFTRQKYEVKILSKKSNTHMYNQLKEEIRILLKFRISKNVINLVDVFEDSLSTYLVVKHCKRGNLNDILDGTDKLSENVAKRIFYDITLALQSLHDKNIVHRRLSLEAIQIKQITKNSVKL